jgi:transcriptional regulator with XRE-family HTH domain
MTEEKEKTLEEKVGQTIKERREKENLTQIELGNLIGKNGNVIYTIEAGRRLPTIQELTKFADLMNMTKESFFPDGKVPFLKSDTYPNKKGGKRQYGQPYHATSSIGKPGENEEGISFDIEDEKEVAADKDEQTHNNPVNSIIVMDKDDKNEVKVTISIPKKFKGSVKIQEILVTFEEQD